jgi:hypothetical protein
LQNGIFIGKSNFKRFGQSNTQIKEKSFWFLATEVGDENLLKTMGDFENEKIPLKKMARQG